MAKRNGFKIIVIMDDNPNSPTYMETYEERVEDTEMCPISTDDLILISSECEIGMSGYTGYRLLQYYNRTTGEYTNVREEDSTCIPSSSDEVWMNVGQPYCEIDEDGHNTGLLIQEQKQMNINLPNYGEIRYLKMADSACQDERLPIWEEISRSCHLTQVECETVFDGTADVIKRDVNPISPTYGRIITVNETDANCPDCSSISFIWQNVGEMCGDDTYLIEHGITLVPTTKYSVSQKYKKMPSSQDYEPMNEFQFTVVEAQSEDCGYVKPVIMYEYSATTNTVCDDVNHIKYQQKVKMVSYDSGNTWSIVTPIDWIYGDVIEYNSVDCGYIPPPPQYKWEDMDIRYNWICDSCEGGQTIIYKAKGMLSNGNEFLIECDDNTTISSGDVSSTATKIMLGECMNTLGNDAFRNFTDLEGVQFNTRLTHIGDYAFAGDTKLIDCSLPDSVVSIGNSAFRHCISLYYITIPSSVTSIGEYAFYDCDSLIQANVPNGVTRIEACTFGKCDALDEITIGSGVTYFDYQAFSGTSRMNSLTILSPTPPETNGTPSIPSGCTVYVPCSAFLLYSNTSGWKNIISQIMPIESGCNTDKLSAIYSDGSTYTVPYNGSPILTRAEVTASTTPYNQMVSAVMEDGTFSLSAGTFSGCTSLSSLTLNDNITTVPNSAFYKCSGLTSLDVPYVTTFGTSAFADCKSLTSITFNTSGVTLGSGCFARCTSLTELNLPAFTIDYGSTFYGCTNLRRITIDGNQSTEYDYYNVFGGCSNISSVTYTNNVTAIVGYLFSNNTSTFNVNIPSSVKSIGTYAFGNSVNMYGDYDLNNVETIGNSAFCRTNISSVSLGLDEISRYAFSGCTSLSSLTLNEGVKRIGKEAFARCYSLSSVTFPSTLELVNSANYWGPFLYCTGLTTANFTYGLKVIPYGLLANASGITSVSIPSTVETIQYAAFLQCGLTSATIPNSVTSISQQAFYNCKDLTEVSIGSGLTSMEDGAFRGCSSLETIDINRSNTVYNSRFGCNAIIETATNKLIVGCKNTTILDTVTSIGSQAFFGCTGLTSINIPNNVTSIGNQAFQDCSGLTSVTLSTSITEMPWCGFQACSGLTEVTIPSGVTNVKYGCFNRCTGLKTVTVEAVTPPALGDRVFEFVNLTSIRVPSGSVNSYKTATGWKNYYNIITEI